MADQQARLSEAIRRALLGYTHGDGRNRWIREDLLPALAAAGLAVVDAGELEQLQADREAWRMKCHVDEEQARAAGLTLPMLKRWASARPKTDPLIRELVFELGDFPTAKRWAMAINRCTPTAADAQRLLDEIVAAGAPVGS